MQHPLAVPPADLPVLVDAIEANNPFEVALAAEAMGLPQGESCKSHPTQQKYCIFHVKFRYVSVGRIYSFYGKSKRKNHIRLQPTILEF